MTSGFSNSNGITVCYTRLVFAYDRLGWMINNYLHYKFSQGFIHHWLVAGPMTTKLSVQVKRPDGTWMEDTYHRYYSLESEVTAPVVDRMPLGPVSLEKPDLIWKYYRCREDHFIDLSSTYRELEYLKSWAFARIALPETGDYRIRIAAAGPFDLWVNGQHMHRYPGKPDPKIQRISVVLNFQEVENDLLIRFEQITSGEAFYGIAVEFLDPLDESARIFLPTEIEQELIEKRLRLEEGVDRAHIYKYVYGYPDGDRYNQNEPVVLHFPAGLNRGGDLVCRLQSLVGNIFQERSIPLEYPPEVELAKAFPLWNGPHHIALLPPAVEYYTKKVAFERKELFYIVRQPHTIKPYGAISQRKKEALVIASEQHTGDIFSEIAKMKLKAWNRVDRGLLEKALKRIQRCEEGSILDVLGLAGALQRYGSHKNLLGVLKPEIHAALLEYRYSSSEPGWDAMDFTSESRQLLFLVDEILAGQILPESVFTRSGLTGSEHQKRAEAQVLAWLRQRGLYGFQMWDSPKSVEAILAGLSHLADLAHSQPVRELSSVLQDKIFFSLTVNSYKGLHGSARAESDIASVLSHRLSPVSGITRLMWGQGNYNSHVLGTVSLACCQSYKLPGVLRDIAGDEKAVLWGLEQHASPIEMESRSIQSANKATYRTSDFMLSSVQDYLPGRPGSSEHIWVATLGPDAVIFTNHPRNMSENDSARPNLWVGNGILPRVIQWGDVLLALYQLPENDWLGYTHAYFPMKTFDEYAIEAGWAFARVGKGYLALTAASGITPIYSGPTAYRELRSYGQQNLWLCHMGQQLLDGSFEDFRAKIQAMAFSSDGAIVDFRSLRGDRIEFGWSGPLRINGQVQPIADFPHFENPYCAVTLPARQMEIVHNQNGIRLTFEDQ
jgi:hypothetical protein